MYFKKIFVRILFCCKITTCTWVTQIEFIANIDIVALKNVIYIINIWKFLFKAVLANFCLLIISICLVLGKALTVK